MLDIIWPDDFSDNIGSINTTDSDSSISPSEGGISAKAIAGISVGGVAAAFLTAIVLWYLVRRHRRRQHDELILPVKDSELSTESGTLEHKPELQAVSPGRYATRSELHADPAFRSQGSPMSTNGPLSLSYELDSPIAERSPRLLRRTTA